HLIKEGIERIAAVTDTDATEIIEALIGLAWDDEDAGIIHRFMIDTPADENERLRQDAERYRWLRKGESDDVAGVRGLGAMAYGRSAVAYTYSEEIGGDDLDAAIDAAMSKEGKQ